MQLQRRLPGDARGDFKCAGGIAGSIKDSEDEVVLKACITTLRSPFRLEKEISLKRDESAITIRERLTNLAKEPMELMWAITHVGNLFWIAAAGLTQWDRGFFHGSARF